MSVELGHRPPGLFSVMVDPSSSSHTVPLGPKTSRRNFSSEELRTRSVPDYSDDSRAESGSEQGISSSWFSQPLREQVVSSPCSSWRSRGVPGVGEGTRPRAHNEEPENSQDFCFQGQCSSISPSQHTMSTLHFTLVETENPDRKVSFSQDHMSGRSR